MTTYNLGNILYYDSLAVINKGKETCIYKIGLIGTGGPCEVTLTVNGTAAFKLFAMGAESNGAYCKYEDFSPPLYVTNASILSVTAGSAYLYIA